MRFSTLGLGLGALVLATATPAFAQDAPTDVPKDVTVTGSVTAISDYRFRGLTQTDEGPAIQGTVNVNHASGFYVGVWASSIDGGSDGSTPLLTNYGAAEVDLYGGFTKTFSSGVGVDVGLLYYYYVDGASAVNTDFFEPYASLTYTIGPISTKLGAAYAWGGQKGLDFTAGNDENFYVFGDASVGIPNTPVTLKGHLGFTNGSLGLANPVATDDSYTDWSLTAEAVFGRFKVGASYVDTDIGNNRVAGVGNYAQRLGRGATGLGYVAFSF